MGACGGGGGGGGAKEGEGEGGGEEGKGERANFRVHLPDAGSQNLNSPCRTSLMSTTSLQLSFFMFRCSSRGILCVFVVFGVREVGLRAELVCHAWFERKMGLAARPHQRTTGVLPRDILQDQTDLTIAARKALRKEADTHDASTACNPVGYFPRSRPSLT